MVDNSETRGRIAGARWCPSPNHDARPEADDISLLVLHCISLPPGGFGGEHIEQLFLNSLDCDAHPYFAQLRGLRVSAHFLIDRRGALTQFVDCDRRAWHAGVSRLGSRERCNDFSIGIELEGDETTRYEAAQYLALASLVTTLRERYPGLRAGNVVAHSDIAPGRKTDPGASFDWSRLRELLRRGHSGS